MKKTLAALTTSVGFVLLAMVAGEVPASAEARADYGAHVSDHARAEGGFSSAMNPGGHRGFTGYDEHHDH